MAVVGLGVTQGQKELASADPGGPPVLVGSVTDQFGHKTVTEALGDGTTTTAAPFKVTAVPRPPGRTAEIDYTRYQRVYEGGVASLDELWRPWPH